MSSSSRETVRDAFAALLETALVGDGLPAQAVYGYQVGDFAGATPVVTCSSGPIFREKRSMGACWTTLAQLYVHVFVLYSDEGTWGEDDAEDALDDIEALVADVIMDNKSNAGVWSNIRYAEPTLTDGVEIGGVEYRREAITLEFEVIENG